MRTMWFILEGVKIPCSYDRDDLKKSIKINMLMKLSQDIE